MSRGSRLAGHVADGLRAGTIGAGGIRISTKRQVLNRPHEFFEIGI
ncbi:MAG TPA: hypothetical protein VLT90_11020 [Terriglobales bacterium]|nr:hypothetical protein [Terriglobales bacterium]